MRSRPTQSYTNLRYFTEKWKWINPLTGKEDIGYVHPQTAINPQRVPFKIKFLTKTGHVDEGICTCLMVDTNRHMRRVQFVDSKAIRWVYDILVLEVDGTRFITH